MSTVSETTALVRDGLTSFVGRQNEVATVRRLLGASRVVTLTGPGGVGKTRLAGQVMHRVARAFAGGVVLAELAELHDGDLLPNLVADRLGLQDRSGRTARAAVLDYLRERHTLLVLDNCEHLIAACASFAQLLVAGCPRVVVLATSRQSLGIAGEQVMPVAPLEVSRDAVELFVDRAAAVVPGFQRTIDNEADLLRIAKRLDGLPLAIELAAARIRSLSPAQLAERLAGLALQTLRDTIDWSYELCSPAEQAVWARASVFAGSFDLDAAEYVCGGQDVDADVLDVIDGLLDKSMLLREDGEDRVRYRMLETLRQYGRERLAESGDVERVARRHRDWFDQLTETADAQWSSPRQVEWVTRLRADHANIRAALAWSIAQAGEAGVALRMATRLDEYWGLIRGASGEAQLWLDRALAAAPAGHRDRPHAVTVSALHCLWQVKRDEAERRLTAAAELASGAGDPILDARITYVRSLAAMFRRDRETAAALAAAAAATFREQGDVRRELHPLFIEGVTQAYQGNLAAGRRALRRMIDLAESAGDVFYQAMAYFGLAWVEIDLGDPEVAAAAALQSLRCDLPLGARLTSAYRLDGAAWVADRQGDHVRAATLFGAAATEWEAAGSTPEVAVATPHRKHRDSTRAALGEAQFGKAYAAGQAMAREEAIRYALGSAGPEPPAPDRYGPLSKRESEIADLVAEGLTNRQIATKLVIAQRTADTHVEHILTKLDLANRAQIAAWIAARR